MKNLIAVCVTGAVLTANSVFALTTKVDWAPNHSPNGGEFILTPDVGDPFRSFCLERNESVSLGSTYDVTVNSAAVLGGVGGGSPDPLGIGSAWLYRQFRDGLLTYNTGLVADQTALQNAFWWIEDEIAIADPSTNPYLAAAKTALAFANFSDLKADAAIGAYGVVVWNLSNTTPDGVTHLNQDMLALPDGGLTLAMLGLGFMGIETLRRKLKA